MKDIVDSESIEYKLLLRSINYYITAASEFEIVLFLKRLNEYENSHKYREELDSLKKSVKNSKIEIKQLYYEYFEAMNKLIGNRVLLFLFFAKIVLRVLLFSLKNIVLIKKTSHSENGEYLQGMNTVPKMQKARDLVKEGRSIAKEIQDNMHYYRSNISECQQC